MGFAARTHPTDLAWNPERGTCDLINPATKTLFPGRI